MPLWTAPSYVKFLWANQAKGFYAAACITQSYFEHLCKQYCGKKFYHSYFEHFYKMNRQNKKIKEDTEKIKAKTEDIRDHSYIT